MKFWINNRRSYQPQLFFFRMFLCINSLRTVKPRNSRVFSDVFFFRDLMTIHLVKFPPMPETEGVRFQQQLRKTFPETNRSSRCSSKVYAHFGNRSYFGLSQMNLVSKPCTRLFGRERRQGHTPGPLRDVPHESS